jgi:hypothetical protein
VDTHLLEELLSSSLNLHPFCVKLQAHLA